MRRRRSFTIAIDATAATPTAMTSVDLLPLQACELAPPHVTRLRSTDQLGRFTHLFGLGRSWLIGHWLEAPESQAVTNHED
jgi:hypothetical protein